MSDIAAKRAAFRKLHDSFFVLPNATNAGEARRLAGLGRMLFPEERAPKLNEKIRAHWADHDDRTQTAGPFEHRGGAHRCCRQPFRPRPDTNSKFVSLKFKSKDRSEPKPPAC